MLWTGFFGTIIGTFSVYVYDYTAVMSHGFFQGYNSIVWTVIVLQVSLKDKIVLIDKNIIDFKHENNKRL